VSGASIIYQRFSAVNAVVGDSKNVARLFLIIILVFVNAAEYTKENYRAVWMQTGPHKTVTSDSAGRFNAVWLA
jgi:hypothetical protein